MEPSYFKHMILSNCARELFANCILEFCVKQGGLATSQTGSIMWTYKNLAFAPTVFQEFSSGDKLSLQLAWIFRNLIEIEVAYYAIFKSWSAEW